MSRLIYLATNNLHKVEEIGAALASTDIQLLPASAIAPGIEWQETGQSFQENARIKALALRTKTSSAVLADDSGLVVDALGGAPGIYSSRYAGERANDQDNVAKLLKELAHVPEGKRHARFVCSLCFIDEFGKEFSLEAYCKGSIALARAGDQGFGYDPVFLLSSGKSMAQISQAEKNKLSHRGQALIKLLKVLKA